MLPPTWVLLKDEIWGIANISAPSPVAINPVPSFNLIQHENMINLLLINALWFSLSSFFKYFAHSLSVNILILKI